MEEWGAGVRRDIEEDGGGAGRKRYVNLKGGVAKATQKALKCNGFLTSLLTTLHLWTPEVTISLYFTCKTNHRTRRTQPGKHLLIAYDL